MNGGGRAEMKTIRGTQPMRKVLRSQPSQAIDAVYIPITKVASTNGVVV